MNKVKYNILQKLLIRLFFRNVKMQYKRPDLALWELIDNENQKPENEIRCVYIEAWEAAIEEMELSTER